MITQTRLASRTTTEYSAIMSKICTTGSDSAGVVSCPAVSPAITPANAISGRRRRQPSATVTTTTASTPTYSSGCGIRWRGQ